MTPKICADEALRLRSPPHDPWPSAVGVEPRLVPAEPTARSRSPVPRPRSTGRWSAGSMNSKSAEGAPLMGGRNRQLTAAMAAPKMAAETVAAGSPLEVAASTPLAGERPTDLLLFLRCSVSPASGAPAEVGGP